MLPQPIHEFISAPLTGSRVEHQPFLFVDARVNLKAVEHQKDFHRRMADALVSIDEGMVRHQSKPQGCRLFDGRSRADAG